MHFPATDGFIRINGEERPVRLTLGALAEIEHAFGGDTDSMMKRIGSLSFNDIMVILNILLNAGGAETSMSSLKKSDVRVDDAVAAVSAAFRTLSAGECLEKSRPDRV